LNNKKSKPGTSGNAVRPRRSQKNINERGASMKRPNTTA
jgi:hypothetical protein